MSKLIECFKGVLGRRISGDTFSEPGLETEKDIKQLIPVLKAGDFERFKRILYSTYPWPREDNTMGYLCVAEQKLTQISSVNIVDTYNRFLGQLLHPDNIPETDAVITNDSLRQNFEGLLAYFLASDDMPQETVFKSALTLANDEPLLEILSAKGVKNIGLLLPKIIARHQTDRSLMPVWWAILGEETDEIRNQTPGIFLYQHYSIGFLGLARLPASDGNLNQPPLDILPPALDLCIAQVNKHGGTRDHAGFRLEMAQLIPWLVKNQAFQDVLARTDQDNWPVWAINLFESY